MFFNLFNRRKHFVQEQIEEYFVALHKCKQAFHEAMYNFINQGKVDQVYIEAVQRTKKYEGIADDIRDNVEMQMYEHSLIPETRGDVLAFLETIDTMPNSMEAIVKFVDEVGLTFPNLPADEVIWFRREIYSLCDTVVQAFELAVESAGWFFKDPRRVREYSVAIDRKESDADAIEANLKRYVFRREEFDVLQKMMFRRLLVKMGDIGDLAEKFQRRIVLLSLKHLY